MGKICSKCFNKEDSNDQYRKMTNVAPFEIEDSILEEEERDEEFHFIPNEEQVDKVITYLDKLSKLSEKDVNLLYETLKDLQKHLERYKPHAKLRPLRDKPFSYLASPPSSDLNRMGSYTPSSHFGPSHSSMSGSHLLTASLQEKDKKMTYSSSGAQSQGNNSQRSTPNKLQTIKEEGKQNPNLVIGIQYGKFLHENILEKYKLSAPYVVVKVYLKPYVKMDSSAPSPNSLIKEFKTNKCEDSLRPKWNLNFQHQLEVEEERKEKEKKLGTYSVGISMYYSGMEGKKDWQVGQEQHFSLISLMDQKIERMTIDFKDVQLKGVLARLHVRLQVVHNMAQAKEDLIQEIEVRIENLLRIREKHMLMPGSKESYNSYLYGNMAGAEQSMVSNYSLHGLKDGDYFMATSMV